MPGTKWVTNDIITFARMNQKTVIVQAAEPAIMYAGMLWFDTDDDKLKQRNAANNAWIERPGVTLAATISGLWTFDRGAAPPFAVDAASTKVTNLDADLLDGEEAAAIVTDGRVKAHFPDTLANIISDLPVGVYATLFNTAFPIATVLTDHDKAAHDALGITPEEMDPSPAVNDTGSELHITTDTVGENVDPGEVLYMKADGKYWLADADAAATMPAKVMAMETILANAAGKLLHSGYFRHDAWNWVLGNGAANLLYVHTTAGAMVQLANKPSGAGDQLQILGYVVTADIVFFDPCLVLAEIVP